MTSQRSRPLAAKPAALTRTGKTHEEKIRELHPVMKLADLMEKMKEKGLVAE